MKSTMLSITLVVEHSDNVDPIDVVNNILDVGTIQTAIVEYVDDMIDDGTIEVTSSECKKEDSHAV